MLINLQNPKNLLIILAIFVLVFVSFGSLLVHTAI